MILLRFYEGLSQAEQFSYLCGVAGIYQARMAKVSFLLFRLLRQDVTVKSVLSLDFTRSGKSESFFSTGVSLDLWHLVKF